MAVQQTLASVDEATLQAVATEEKIDLDTLQARVQNGEVVIWGEADGAVKAMGIGTGLRTKVNANIGTSPDFSELEDELEKLHAALSVGADTIMDLSISGDIDRIRREIRAACDVPLGIVPIYQAAIEAQQRYGSIDKMTVDQIFEVIERQAADGVDFMTLHCGVTRRSVAALDSSERVCGIVSRGGSMLAKWMEDNNAENPLYEHYDRLLAILRRYGVSASLGDGLRPGAVADGSDRGQISETQVLGELVLRARESGVQVFVEGPGHIPLDQIAGNVILQKRLCHNAPFYVLGPIVTDIAPGYDHITSAIGAALCAAAGADYLCYVTPAEHLGLPTTDDVVEGVITARIAAHAADIVKGVPGAAQWDEQMSRARRDLDWTTMTELAIDPGEVIRRRGERASLDPAACSMCGKFCSMKIDQTRHHAGT